jgi:ATP phosphoribosyltransferase regulatory subunit
MAARLRSIGWRTVAALSLTDNAGALGCSHVLSAEGAEPV